MSDERQVYTPQQLAEERWQCSYETVLERIQDRSLRAFNVARGKRPLWRIPLSAVLEFELGAAPTGRRTRRAAKPSLSRVCRY